MKNIIRKVVSIFAIVAVLASCDRALDINDNPNYPSDATVSMLLPSAQIAMAGILGGDMELVGSLWSQHYTQNSASNQYNTTVNYTISNASYSRFWTIPYTMSLPDLNIIHNLATEQKLDNYIMVSEIMSCYIFNILSSWYENIPYSESIQGEDKLYPKYDDGKTINTALLARLDAALAKAASAKASPQTMSNDDLIFSGNVDKWVAFGKSLKLKLLMLDFQANKAAITTLINEGGFLTVDGMINKFTDKENSSNPLYENDRRKLNTATNLAASAVLVKFLQDAKDPRIAVFFNKNAAGEYYGLIPGDRPATSVVPKNKISLAVLAPEDPVYFISVAEMYFLQAEAWARIGNAANAKANYDKGVTAAFNRWSFDASAFIKEGGKYAFDATSEATMLRSIFTQKWVAAVRCQAWGSYFDINRAGYPVLGKDRPGDAGYVLGNICPVVDSSLNPEEFPKRFMYPKVSSDNNPNAPKPIAITVKQWWHK